MPSSEVAAAVDGHDIRKKLVERWGRFEAGIRASLGLQTLPPEVVEATALKSLIEARWIQKEAATQDVAIESDERPLVVAKFEEKLSVSNEQIHDLRRASKLGMPTFEALIIAKALEEEIAWLGVSSPSVSRAALRRYYRRHAGELGEPERRTFNFLVAATESDAMQAMLRRESGQSWRKVADEYSQPSVLEQYGSQIAEVTQAEVSPIQGRGVARKAFTASKYELVGPMPIQGGWLSFEVENVMPGFEPAFPVVREAIRNRLIDRRWRSALRSLKRRLRAKYADTTQCAEEFRLTWCRPLTKGQ